MFVLFILMMATFVLVGTWSFQWCQKSLMYSRFMLRLGFAGVLYMPKFLISVYNICRHTNYVSKTGNVLSHIYHITIIWPNGWNLNLKIKLYRKHVSEIRFWWFTFVGSKWLRSRATMCRRYNGHGMLVCIHLVAPFQGKSPLTRHHAATVHTQWRP